MTGAKTAGAATGAPAWPPAQASFQVVDRAYQVEPGSNRGVSPQSVRAAAALSATVGILVLSRSQWWRDTPKKQEEVKEMDGMEIQILEGGSYQVTQSESNGVDPRWIGRAKTAERAAVMVLRDRCDDLSGRLLASALAPVIEVGMPGPLTLTRPWLDQWISVMGLKGDRAELAGPLACAQGDAAEVQRELRRALEIENAPELVRALELAAETEDLVIQYALSSLKGLNPAEPEGD